MKKMFKMMMLTATISGTMITSSSYSWMGMWMGMEINLLCIIPLMHNKMNSYSSESAIKYFITQTIASTLFMFAIILMNSPLNEIINPTLMVNISMFTKMGAAPFHFWLPEIIEGLSWLNCLLVLTWQKLAPLLVLVSSINNKQLLITVIISSMLVGGILGINQTSMRKILVFSSINHLGWMMSAFMEKESIGLLYFFMYTFITFNMIAMFNKMNILYTNQMFSKMNNKLSNKIALSMNFMSLGGLPPMLGFYPKWMTLNSIIINNHMILALIMVLSTLLTLYFYMRIVILTLLTNPSKMTLINSQQHNFHMNMINSINLLALPICSLWFNLN